jgi:hypothetical protein
MSLPTFAGNGVVGIHLFLSRGIRGCAVPPKLQTQVRQQHFVARSSSGNLLFRDGNDSNVRGSRSLALPKGARADS